MKTLNQCQHSTKLTGECVKCGQYPYDNMNKTDKAVNPVIEAVDKLVTEGGYTLEPERNVIKDLGKFEGEHVMTLYFYDAFMNGDGEQYGDDNDLSFNVSDDEAEAFNVSKGSQVILCFSEQGFVTSYVNS